MGYRHSREEILSAATELALEGGMARLTFASVAARLGISDRMVVYYFPTKAELVSAVAAALGMELEGLLEAAFGSEPLSAAELTRRAWPILTTPVADRVFALYFEMIGLAMARQAPYVTLMQVLTDRWAEWLGPRTQAATAEGGRAEALRTIAEIDGLLLVRHLLGPEAGEAARVAGSGVSTE